LRPRLYAVVRFADSLPLSCCQRPVTVISFAHSRAEVPLRKV